MTQYAAELRRFLAAARGRITPQSLGLPTSRRRQVPGLRRGEVAALIGVSEEWYARFESGRARFSLRALERVADALCLDATERRELQRLAIPELSRMPPLPASHASRELRALRDFSLRCDGASSPTELSALALGCIRSGIPGARLASSLERLADGTWRHHSDRPDIEGALNASPVDDDLVSAASFEIVSNVAMIGSPDYRHVDHRYADQVTAKTELRSGFGVRLPVSERFMGCAFGEAGVVPTTAQVLFLNAIAITFDLTRIAAA